jgi:hypothetical protein
LQLDAADFREGVFSWRGFLYYKWSLLEFCPSLIQALRQVKQINPTGTASREQKIYIATTRQAIVRGAKTVTDDVRKILDVYDQAYDNLINNHDVSGFREFLLTAPAMFLEIGEKMGALTHITSFWQSFRISPRASSKRPRSRLEDTSALGSTVDIQNTLQPAPPPRVAACISL